MPPNSMGQNMPPNSTQGMPISSSGQSMPPSSMGQSVPPTSIPQGPPEIKTEDGRAITPEASASQDSQDLPFSSYNIKQELSPMPSSQSVDSMNSSNNFSNTSTTMSSAGRQFPFGDQFTGKTER